MTLFVYSIVDEKSPNYSKVYMSENHEVAMRIFYSTLTLKDSQYFKFPKDYYLVCLGSFDTVTGKFTNQDIEIVKTGSSFVDELLFAVSEYEKAVEKFVQLEKTSATGENASASESVSPSLSAPAASGNNEGEKKSKTGNCKASRGE